MKDARLCLALFASLVVFGCGGGGGGGRSPAGAAVGRAMIQMSLVLSPETQALLTPAILQSLKAQGMNVVNGKLVTPPAPLVGRWITIATESVMTDTQGFFRLDAVPAGASQGQIFRSLGDAAPEGTFPLSKLAAEGNAPQPITLQVTLNGPVEMNPPFRSASKTAAAAPPARSATTRDSCILRTPCMPGDNSTGCCLDYDGAAGDGRPLLRHDPQTAACKAQAVVNFLGSTCFNWSFGVAGTLAQIGGTDCWNEQAYQVIGNNAPGCWTNHMFRNCQNLDKTDFFVIPGSATVTPGQSITIRLRNNTPANDTVLSISQPNLPGTLAYGTLSPNPGGPLRQVGNKYVIDHFDLPNTKHYEDIEIVYTAPSTLPSGAPCDTLHLKFQAYGQTKTFDIGFNFGAGTGTPILIHNAAELASFGGTAIACGPLSISGTDITSLQALSSLKQVNGPLTISFTSITTLDGLQFLNTVAGRITIAANPQLASFSGLSALKQATGFLIQSNPKLTSVTGIIAPLTMDFLEVNSNPLLPNLDGFSGIIHGELASGLFVLNNAALTSIAGLKQISLVGQLDIENNDALADLTGLNGITQVVRTAQGQGDFTVRGRAITSLAGLANLQFVDGLVTIDQRDFAVLTDYRLSGLQRIGSNLYIRGGQGPIKTVSLLGLNDVSGSVQVFADNGNGFQSISFGLLTHVGGIVDIRGSNTRTIDMKHLTIVGSFVAVRDNPALTDLNVDSLVKVGNYIQIVNNAALARLNLGGPTVTAYLEIRDNPALSSFSMGDFTTGQHLNFINNDAITNLSFGPGTINTNLQIQNNQGFTNAQAQTFANTLTVKGSTTISGNG